MLTPNTKDSLHAIHLNIRGEYLPQADLLLCYIDGVFNECRQPKIQCPTAA